jgi:dynein light chain 1|tara:strand:+ start:697 stop:927 length:231 start_codon:yes stop_codon:yes gene_type:complete
LCKLYISNNNIKSWTELDKLATLGCLEDVLLVGNPIYAEFSKEDARIEVLKHIPNLKKLDGEMVKPNEREAAQQAV